MTNVAEFIAVRERIELLAKQIAVLTERKTVPQSRSKLDEAGQLLTKLTAMADNDVQEIAVKRLTRLLGTLGKKVATLPPKARPKKERLSS